MAIEEVIRPLVDIGLVDVILPFLLVFTIVYATLQKTEVLGPDKRRMNTMVAFVIGFLTVLATSLLNVINVLLSWFVLVLLAGLLVAMVFGLVGAETGNRNKVLGAIMLILFPMFLIYGLSKAGILSQNRFLTMILIPVIILGMIIISVFFVFEKQKPETPARTEPVQQAGPTPRLTREQAEELERILRGRES